MAAKKESTGAPVDVTAETFNRGAAYPYTRRDSILVIGPVERPTYIPGGVAKPGDYLLLEGDELRAVSEETLLGEFIPVSENKRLK